MELDQVVRGAATCIPGVSKVLSAWRPERTGGTDNAKYCYSVWLKHLTRLWASGSRRIPVTVAELGPGDSLGTGLAALLTGVEHYYALDVASYADPQRSIAILDELVQLFEERAT